MKKRVSLVPLFLAFSSFIFGQTVTLEEALQRKWVASTIIMKSSSIEVSLKNLRKENIALTIPVGFIFQSADSNIQDFIHLEKRMYLLHPSVTAPCKWMRCAFVPTECHLQKAAFFCLQPSQRDIFSL